MKRRKQILYVLGGLALLFLVLTVGWMVTEAGFEATSNAEFCGLCHVMQPMVAAYQDSVHGGNNPAGVAASCSDCHVDHSNPVAYYYTKARSGTIDTWVALTSNEFAIDWQARREERDRFVYDSGCLQCHSNLENISAGKDAHAKYFAGLIDAQCVDCHESVGHANLNEHLLLMEVQHKYAP